MAWWNQRADLRIEEFYRAVMKYGYVVSWEKAQKCPCILTEGPEQPDFNCPLCRGKGHVWSNPLVIRGIMTNFSENMKYNQTGEIAAGVSYFTTLPHFRMNRFDRITNFHSTIRYDQVIVKGDHNSTDILRFRPIDVLSVRTVDKVYQNKLDYKLEKYAGINWLPTGNEPSTGERYSISYMMHPAWIIMDLPNVVRDTYVKSKRAGLTFQQLPQKALVQLEYFVFPGN